MFPVQPGQKGPPALHGEDTCPRTGICARGHLKWEQRASTDSAVIRRCWEHTPYNPGIAVGPSRLIVIDLDKPKPGQTPPPHWAQPGIIDGADVLAALCQRHGQPFPSETFTVRTGSGGLHLYFTTPPGLRLRNTSGHSRRGLGWLIDTRASGGYVLAPGSTVSDTGPYTVAHDQPPAPLPDWLAGLLNPARHQAPAVECSPPATKVGKPGTYAQTALNNEVTRVLHSPDHAHNWALNKAAFNLGRHIGAGILNRELTEEALQAAGEAAHTKDTPNQIRAVIQAGINAGIRKTHRSTP